MKKEIALFETAKLANKAGFNISNKFNNFTSVYSIQGVHTFVEDFGVNGNGVFGYILAPTRSSLQRWIMKERDVLISIDKNASGYFWTLSKNSTGTNLGWSDHSGTNEGGMWDNYDDAFDNVLKLVLTKSLDELKDKLKDKFHWGLYADFLLHRLKDEDN